MRNLKKNLTIGGFVLLAASASMSAFTFNVAGIKWPGARTTLYVGMPGTSSSGTRWRDALTRAAQEWTDKTPFTFVVDQSYRDPCKGYGSGGAGSDFPSGSGDERNGADFAATVCGNEFGTNVLAVSLVYTESNLLGGFDITEADMVFNSNSRFDIYDGPLASQGIGTDFGRVALHEMGHVMGMSHEQSNASIMRATIGNLFTLQPDDIEGATTLYTGYTNCPVTQLEYGSVEGQLADGDCTVKQLVGGGSDDSLVDTYELELEQPTTVTIAMRSNILDSVLVLMDGNSEVLDVDDDGGTECDAQISTTLAAGTYVILANTFVDDSECGATSGPYEITVSYHSSNLIERGRPTSLLGTTSNATFSGGVKARNKINYSNLVNADETFDIEGRIDIDPLHQGQAGFIVVAGILDNGEILLRNVHGEFIPYTGEGDIIKANSKVLSVLEIVDILSDTRALDLGLSEIEVNFLVGYGVNSNPKELYFHTAPINLVVAPEGGGPK